MAKAPRPTPDGAQAEAERTAQDQMITTFVVRGVEYRLALRNVPLTEKVQVKAQVGMSWSMVIGEDGTGVGIESVAVLVWLARRAAGERSLRWGQFVLDWDDEISMADVSFAADDPAGDDPEA